MSGLTVVLLLVVLIWFGWFVTKGFLHGARLLRLPPSGAELSPTPMLRDIAVVLLVGVGGVIVGTILVIAAWVTERESLVLEHQARIVRLENRVRVYEEGLRRLEGRIDADARAGEAQAERLATDLREEIAALRRRLAGAP